MDRAEYKRRVEEELSALLLGPGRTARVLDQEEGSRRSRVRVEEVRLDAYGADEDTVVVLYRHLSHPECLFGYRMEVTELTSSGDDPSEIKPEFGPEIWTTIVWANFQEHVYGSLPGLPEDCNPDCIKWTG